MPIHEQRRLPGGAAVDTGIADLLEALWNLGLRTRFSCEGTSAERGDEEDSGSPAYIMFPAAADAFEFFSQTLEAISTPAYLAQIVVDVRYLTKGSTPGWRSLKRGPAVSLEFGVDPTAHERRLRGTVRFDPELMPRIEAAFAADGPRDARAAPTESAGCKAVTPKAVVDRPGESVGGVA